MLGKVRQSILILRNMDMFVWRSGFHSPLGYTHFNLFVDEWTNADESPTPGTGARDTPPRPRNRSRAWDQRYPTSPMDRHRQTPVKTSPSRNLVGGW